MVCPYCGKEMEQGYISCRDGVYWCEKKHIIPPLLGLGKDRKIDLNTQENHVKAFICEHCRKVVIEY